jgi:hypothetical protein
MRQASILEHDVIFDIEHRARAGSVLAHPPIFTAGGSKLIA